MKLRRAQQRILKACAVALGLHLLLLASLPGIPEFSLPDYDAGESLFVFLEQDPEPEVLDQSLNLPSPTPETDQQNVQQQATVANQEIGEDDLPSEAKPQVSAPEQMGKSSEQSGRAKPSGFVLRYSDIVRFTQTLAKERAEANPEEVARFVRSFNLDPSPLQNTRIVSYRNRFGDSFVEDRAGAGDICFVQRAEPSQDDFSGQYVQFYRCDRKPLKLELGKPSAG